jgi:hypothetical protein
MALIFAIWHNIIIPIDYYTILKLLRLRLNFSFQVFERY